MNLEGLILISPQVFHDNRGFFFESYQKKRYEQLGVTLDFVQDNHSYSMQNVLRGLHCQHGQAKLISCPRGKIFDVAVDLRKHSPTFGKWQGFILDGERHEQLFIPDGFAHGFCVLSDYAHVLYKVSSYHNAHTERGFRYDSVGIEWPITDPILSERDRNAGPMEAVV